jgi:hypothetical protein
MMMGRLAGDSIARQQRRTWKERVRQAREDKAAWGSLPAAPLAVLGAARRQMALLWWLCGDTGPSATVGARGMPPLTPDMRVLIRKGYLKLARHGSYMPANPLRRDNVLTITPAGQQALAAAHVTEAEKNYIIAARKNGMLR